MHASRESMARRIAAPLFVLLLVAVPWIVPPVAAQPSDADKATARRLLDEGDAKLAAGDRAGALAAFQGADGLMKVPTTGLPLAKTQIALGLLVEASTTLLRVIRYRHPPAEAEPDAFAQARAEAAGLAVSLGPRTPSVTLAPSGLAQGVEPVVSIDGGAIAPAALRLPRDLNPGEHRLVAEAPGYRTIERSFTLQEGERLRLPLAFEVVPNAVVPPTASASASVTAAPTASGEPPPPPPGDSGGGPGTASWIALGVGAAALVAGGITGGIAMSQGSSLRDRCAADAAAGDTACTPEIQADLDSALAIAHTSTAMLALGGAAVITGAVLWIVGASESRATPAAAVTPIVGPGTVGVTGRF